MSQGETYLGSYEFKVEFEELTGSMGFSKITNLESKIEYDTILEGGNDKPVLFPKPRTQADVITFERGILVSGDTSLWKKIKTGTKTGNITIYVLHNQGYQKSFQIAEGLVIEKEYPLLEAGSSQLYVEKLMIAHSGLEEL